jgi:hypothetical protein
MQRVTMQSSIAMPHLNQSLSLLEEMSFVYFQPLTSLLLVHRAISQVFTLQQPANSSNTACS